MFIDAMSFFMAIKKGSLKTQTTKSFIPFFHFCLETKVEQKFKAVASSGLRPPSPKEKEI